LKTSACPTITLGPVPSLLEKQGNHDFLKGPIPIAWLKKVPALPGKAFQTGVVLWYLCGLRKNKTIVLANGLLEQFHISHQVKYRCLRALEGAGLVAVEERQDRNPRITIMVGLARLRRFDRL